MAGGQVISWDAAIFSHKQEGPGKPSQGAKMGLVGIARKRLVPETFGLFLRTDRDWPLLLFGTRSTWTIKPISIA
jgi:hypothetical protein